MEKVLMLASVPSMIGQFNMPNIKLLQEMGYEVHVACNFDDRSVWDNLRVEQFIKQLEECNVTYQQINFSRNILKFAEHKMAYQQLLKLVKSNNYRFIHCHTPIGGAIARLVAHKTNTKIIYTAHGFHFYQGAPLLNWLIFYPVEKYLSKYTDVLITINSEDYNRALKLKANEVFYVPGIGIDDSMFQMCNIEKGVKRKELHIDDNEIVLLSIGELSKRKNHEIVIKAINQLGTKEVKYVICGIGQQEERLKQLANDLGVSSQVQFLGYRGDIDEICRASDIFAFPSLQEGLPVALMEAMASGLPVICSKIRGNTDLVEEQQGGYLVEASNVDDYVQTITKLIKNTSEREKYGAFNKEVIKEYSIDKVNDRMSFIYKKINKL